MLRRRSPEAVTFRHYANDLELFFAWVDKDPPDVTLTDIDAYIAHCQDELGHAFGTINKRLTSIRSFYRFLHSESDDAPPNPVIPQRHYIRQGRRLPRDVEDADVERLFAAIDDVRDQAMFLLMLRCGLRVGEVRNLSTSDLYLQPGQGSLPRLLLHGKRNKERFVFLSAEALDALQAWLDVRPQAGDDAVFLNRYGARFSVTGIQLRIGSYCHQAGVWITCHQLRHVFARHLVEARVPVTSIQKLLGHARLRTTQVYLHVSDPQVQADYEAAMAEVKRLLQPEEGES
jgi:site-specific recombinase XerD